MYYVAQLQHSMWLELACDKWKVNVSSTMRVRVGGEELRLLSLNGCSYYVG